MVIFKNTPQNQVTHIYDYSLTMFQGILPQILLKIFLLFEFDLGVQY